MWLVVCGASEITCSLVQVVKGIDAVTREQLVQILAILGVGNARPVFSMVPGPFKPAGLLPTITEEDRIILNNVQKIVEFLTAGSRSSSQVSLKPSKNEIIHQGGLFMNCCFSCCCCLVLILMLFGFIFLSYKI